MAPTSESVSIKKLLLIETLICGCKTIYNIEIVLDKREYIIKWEMGKEREKEKREER